MFFTVNGKKWVDVFLLLCVAAAALLLVRTAWRISTVQTGSAETAPVLVIDPGHGGIDGGAVAFNGVKESDITSRLHRSSRVLLISAAQKPF